MGRPHSLTHTLPVQAVRAGRSPLLRAADVVAGTVLLLLSAPLLGLLALWVRTSSNGAVFQRQPAVTPGGERCFLLSFRTMIDGAGTATHERMRDLFGTTEAQVVTAPGRVIEALHLVRLPRLVNVVKGEAELF